MGDEETNLFRALNDEHFFFSTRMPDDYTAFAFFHALFDVYLLRVFRTHATVFTRAMPERVQDRIQTADETKWPIQAFHEIMGSPVRVYHVFGFSSP